MGLDVEQVNPIPRWAGLKRVFGGHREGEHGGRIFLPQVHRSGHRDPHPRIVSPEDVAGDPTKALPSLPWPGPAFRTRAWTVGA